MSHERTVACPHAWSALGCAGLAVGLVLLSACGATSSTPGSGGSSAQVTLITDRAHYGVTDTVTASVTNGLASAIQTADHQSNCTIVTIERLEGQAWQPQNPCQLKIATRLIPLAPGSVTAAQLYPPNSGGGWATGTYRIAFTYSLSQPGQDATIFSAQFTIG